MPRKPLNDKAMTGAERQKKYRTRQLQRQQQQDQQRLHKIFLHHQYRVDLNIMLACWGKDAAWLEQRSGINQRVIKTGDEKDCGIFYPKELEVLTRVLPQVPPPPRSLW